MKKICLFAILAAGSSFGALKLPAVISDNMVLQGGRENPVWGWTAEGSDVTVLIGGEKRTCVAGTDGRWQTRLPVLPDGKVYSMTVESGSERLSVTNILVGEVWLASGQSNMQLALKNSSTAAQDVPAAVYPELRLFRTTQQPRSTLQDTVKGQWLVCSPASAAEFSAVAYGFGRNLHTALKRPVGIIQTALGGTPAEAWSRMEDLEALSANKPFLEQSRKLAESKGENYAKLPAVLYNGMIHPFIPYGIKGAIWYQGEGNVSRCETYADVLGKMISGWRAQWQAEFPFYVVQLPAYISADKAKAADPAYDIRLAYETDPNRFVSWTAIQEQQVKATKESRGVYVTPALEFGEPYDIHPKNKAPVAERLSRLVLGQEYGIGSDFRAPEWDGKFVRDGQTVRVHFNNAESGLKVHGDAIKGFALAGEDKVFHWADAKLDGDKVVVQSADVKSPVYIRYLWSSFPQVTLYSASGIPALPFRNDSFAVGTRSQEE